MCAAFATTYFFSLSLSVGLAAPRALHSQIETKCEENELAHFFGRIYDAFKLNTRKNNNARTNSNIVYAAFNSVISVLLFIKATTFFCSLVFFFNFVRFIASKCQHTHKHRQ